jgi:hypothetical protein
MLEQQLPIRRRGVLIGAILILMAVVNGSLPVRAARISHPEQQPAAGPGSFARLPVGFEPNRGQASPGNLFLARTAGYSLALAKNRVVIDGSHPIRFNFEGANAGVQVVGSDKLPGSVNYLLGNRPSRWHVDIPTYRRVVYRDLYKGIDLAYQGTGAAVEATWILAPGADLHRIRVSVSGASRLQLAHDGALSISTPQSRFTVSAPMAYQSSGRERAYVPVHFQLGPAGRLTLRTGTYDHARRLTIDPTLSYGTNLGGSSSDFASGITVDSAGNSYIAGSTSSPDLPVVHAVQRQEPGTTDQEDAFVAKLNPTGSALLFSTYLGGNSDEEGAALALGRGGAVYVAGFTRSSNFPQRRGVIQQKGGCNGGVSGGGDAFVTKLGSRGDKLIYSTCLGGAGTDWGTGIVVDGTGAAIVTGATGSDNFPTAHPLQLHRAGSADAFVAKIAPGGGSLQFSTYLGGKGADEASGVALDSTGSLYVVGSTDSIQFPLRSPVQATLSGGTDVFVTKLNSSDRRILFSTYLGGVGADTASSIAVDHSGDAYLAGKTESNDFPTAHSLQSHIGGAADAFVTELAPDGSSILFSTFFGGSGNDAATAVAVDSAGHIHLTGSTTSPDFPVQHPLQASYAGGYFYGDAFAAELQGSGQSLVYSTYLGGKSDDVGTAIAVSGSGDSYITGGTSSEDFPVTHDIPGGRPSRGNAFVVRVQTGPSTVRRV